MKRLVSIVACALMLWGLLGGKAFALEEAIKRLLHHELESKVLIIHDSNLGDIQKLKTEPKKWIICDVQMQPDKLTADDTATIMAWVEQGGSLWFQDCRMASSFGMEADPLTSDEISKAQEQEGPYNTHKKYKGLAAVCFPFGHHEVLTDVDAVVAFVIPVGPDQYSAVKAVDGVEPLLRTTANPETASAVKMVAALKHVGQGTVIFKPLVWEESLASDRFQANLREWVGGYGVPHIENVAGPYSEPTKSPRQAPDAATGLDQVYMDSGKVVSGIILNQQFRFISTSSMDIGDGVGRYDLRAVDFGGAGADEVTMKDGSRQQGMFEFGPEDLNVRLPDGTVKNYRKTEIKHIDFLSPPPAPESKHGKH